MDNVRELERSDNEVNIKRINKRWALIDKYELEAKNKFLRNLTDEQSIGIFNRLLEFAAGTSEENINKLSFFREEKGRELMRIHKIFNRLK